MSNVIYNKVFELFNDSYESDIPDEQIVNVEKFKSKVFDSFKDKHFCSAGERKLLDKILTESIAQKKNGHSRLKVGNHSQLFQSDFLPEVNIFDLL